MSSNAGSIPDSLGRYSRQILFNGIGRDGQKALCSSRAAIIGCGALGTVQAEILARAGVGSLRIIDRDFIDLSNLHRQSLFDERDLSEGLPKAVAAANKLKAINSMVAIEGLVADLNSGNAAELLDGCQVLLDGTDNFHTRFLLNDFAIKHSIPWVYGACVGSSGVVLPVLPGRKPCLRCLLGTPPPPGLLPTCDTAGIIGPASHAIASVQAAEALKILTGNLGAVLNGQLTIDLWNGIFQLLDTSALCAEEPCTTCFHKKFEYLDAVGESSAVSLCGRNAVQIISGKRVPQDLHVFAQRFSTKDIIILNKYMLRLHLDAYDLAIFPDGRAIIHGTSDQATAKSLYARYIGC